MDFNWSQDEEDFRQEVRAFLQAELPEGWGVTQFWDPDDDSQFEFAHEFTKKLGQKNWLAVAWPKEYGGLEWPFWKQFIFNEELATADAPIVGRNATRFLGPSIFRYGTAEQIQQHIPGILNGETIWCQGYSEPNAGSDLASLQTRAVQDGDEFVVNGQKVWTSNAHDAAFCFLLARTDPDVPKHKGLSCFIVDMKTPGITVKPLRQITGEAEFNEVFFENVRVPRENLVGKLNNGWMVGIGLLMHERATASILNQANVQTLVKDLVALAKLQGRASDPVIRQRLAQLYTEAECVKHFGYRNLTKRLRGLPPGPEGSAHRLGLTLLTQRAQDLAMELQGPYSQLMPGTEHAVQEGAWQYSFLRSRSATISAGTAEIQRNIIAERVLGLPKG